MHGRCTGRRTHEAATYHVAQHAGKTGTPRAVSRRRAVAPPAVVHRAAAHRPAANRAAARHLVLDPAVTHPAVPHRPGVGRLGGGRFGAGRAGAPADPRYPERTTARTRPFRRGVCAARRPGGCGRPR